MKIEGRELKSFTELEKGNLGRKDLGLEMAASLRLGWGVRGCHLGQEQNGSAWKERDILGT